ncbi:hypothetical protein Q7689_31235, partial [Nocardiopsis tropica]|nr:hypothetical protein [Nocardiopsis tropica]
MSAYVTPIGSRCTPTAYRAPWSSWSSTRGLPPVDSARPVSRTRPSSMSARTTVEMVAPVNPVAATSPARLMVPAARMTSRTAALLVVWGVARDGPPKGTSAASVPWRPRGERPRCTPRGPAAAPRRGAYQRTAARAPPPGGGRPTPGRRRRRVHAAGVLLG